jgi:hypothetical protein
MYYITISILVTLVYCNGNSADDTDSSSSDDDETHYGCTFTMSNGSKNGIPDTWILLDSQSTVSTFHNKEFLLNIRSSPTKLIVDTNGWKQISTMVGDLKNFGPVWYNPESIANILLHADVAKQYWITSDSAIERSFHVHKADGTLMTFTASPTGLYFFDAMTALNDNRTNQKVANYLFVNTVAGNKQRFH